MAQGNIVAPDVLADYRPAMADAPKEVRVPIMMARDQLEAIDRWRYANHIPTRAEAIRQLIDRGLSFDDALREVTQRPRNSE